MKKEKGRLFIYILEKRCKKPALPIEAIKIIIIIYNNDFYGFAVQAGFLLNCSKIYTGAK